jgi:CheY-like chemotaxis protein
MPQMNGNFERKILGGLGLASVIIATVVYHYTSCLAAGCSDYLTKPIDVPVLLAALARHLSPAAAGMCSKVA